MNQLTQVKKEYAENRVMRRRYLIFSACFFVLAFWVIACVFISLTCLAVANGYHRNLKQLLADMSVLEQYQEYSLYVQDADEAHGSRVQD